MLCKRPLLQATVRCEPPNSRLYHFTGNLEMPSPLSSEQLVVPVPPAAVLLRGCSLRNTHRMYGLVLYAGGCPELLQGSFGVHARQEAPVTLHPPGTGMDELWE